MDSRHCLGRCLGQCGAEFPPQLRVPRSVVFNGAREDRSLSSSLLLVSLSGYSVVFRVMAGRWRTAVAPLLALVSALVLPLAVASGYSVTVAFFGLALLLTGMATCAIFADLRIKRVHRQRLEAVQAETLQAMPLPTAALSLPPILPMFSPPFAAFPQRLLSSWLPFVPPATPLHASCLPCPLSPKPHP